MSMRLEGEAREKACPKRKTTDIERRVIILALSRVFSKCNKTGKQTQRQDLGGRAEIDKKTERCYSA
jgi:hypothetical protein